MKTKVMKWAIIPLTFGVTVQLYSQGYIVPNGVTYAGNPPGLGSEIHVLQNPTNSDYTGFNFTPQGMTPPTVYVNTFLFNPFLDEGVRTFLVSSNQPISLPAIQSGSYTELMYPNSYVFNNNSPFYVGLYTGYNPFSPTGTYTGIYDDPLFGWALFVNNQGVIEMLDSALVYKAGGIYAGTLSMIPEPSGFAMTALGAFLFASRHRRRPSRVKIMP